MARRCGCSVGASLLALSLAVLLAVPGAAGFHLGGDESGLVRGMLAAVRERAEAEDAARFAVAEHNRKQGSALEFTRVVNAKRQVVAGTLHDLMVEVVDSGKKSMYKAKVWVKPWQNFKAVVEFRHAGDFQSESSVASDGSTGQGTHGVKVPSMEYGTGRREGRNMRF
ncbi:hypothetical protein ACQJBY_007258 [Aegilops geniculata]